MLTKIKTFLSGLSTNQEPTPETKLYDLGLLKDTVGNNPDSLREIITLFLQSKPAELEQLELAVKDHNLSAIARWAHCIKGNLKLFGMDETYNQLVWIELIAKKNEKQWNNDIEVYWQRIDQTFTLILSQLPKELAYMPVG
ncbi:Hpt domain-containing protein [Xanthocytophaga agilis]|uniref:Hpt domain-containing protein n=1 Tax=Xanthocytophaga agilis TaxID=3048010 RepID=A0AAE3RDN7_9BACT|nr:Hpt domain-containing protein [Xanthocytophaga agilis]MDJ1506740.1 Hpt domain-containing protein [Xanthocytophaga agilis]